MKPIKKCYVIGLDGITFNLVRPWAAEGRLPNLARLIEEGASGDLLSTPDMLSPSAWTSFATGDNPGKHGIFNFMDIVPGTFKTKYLTAADRDGVPLWSLLDGLGKRVCVMNVPMSYPADKVNGCMISGWNAPSVKSPGFTHPPELIGEITEKFGDYPLFPTVKKHIMNRRPELAVEDLSENMRRNSDVSRYLMEKEDWDLFVTVFIATDQVQHYFWHYMDPAHPQHDPSAPKRYRDAIYDVYRKCDDFVGEVLGRIDDDTLLVIMSDHGCGMNQGAVQFLPLWLERMGFAAHKKISSGPAALVKGLVGRALKGGYNLLNTRLSVKSKAFLNSLMPGIRDRVESTWRFSAYDWPRTRVYFHYEPRINLKGREPFGSVERADYELLRDTLISKLYECRDLKTGKPIVEKVYKAEDVFHGPRMQSAPDLVILWREDVVISGIKCTREDGTEMTLDEKYVDDLRTGNHTPHGILIMRCSHLKNGETIKGASIMDVAPTILHMMGAEVPSEMDGKVLTEAIDPEFMRANPVMFTSKGQGPHGPAGGAEPEEDDEVIRKRLKDLGYL